MAVVVAVEVAAAAVVVAAVDKSKLPVLGVGMGFRSPFLGDIFQNQSKVDFLEITADHYIEASPEKINELNILRNQFTLIPHGLNLSLGSAEGIDPIYLEQLAELITLVNPPWWSEHIAFTRAGGIDIGHLSPLMFCEQSVDIICGNIEKVKKVVDIPLILENITYCVKIPGSTMSEAEFVAKICNYSDCGLLLDITNIFTNATNYQYSIDEYLQAFPLEKVVQIHFVGGHWQDNILIDSHSQSTPNEVWEIMDKVFAESDIKGAILERDENLPIFSEIITELERAKEIGKKYGRW